MTEVEGGEKTSTLWSNAARGSLVHKLAGILEKRGLGVSVSDRAEDTFGNFLPDDVAIYSSDQGRVILNKTTDSFNFLALDVAQSLAEISLVSFNPKFDDFAQRNRIDASSYAVEGYVFSKFVDELCEWDDNTKRRVKGYFWQNSARKHEKNSQNASSPRSRISEVLSSSSAKIKAIINLASLPPLSPEDINSLLEELVDKIR